MSAVTLDTTVLIKGIIPPMRRKKDSLYREQLRLHLKARDIIQEIEDRKTVMNIPAVCLIEIASVTARLTGKDQRGIQASDYVRDHGNVFYDIFLLNEAIRIGARTRSSGFDTIFIACAKLTNSTLITDDRKMYEAAAKVDVPAKLLRDIT